MIDPVKLPQMAEARADENFDFRDFLKPHSELNLVDRLVFGISQRVWKTIDCTACGNCCRAVSPTLKDDDVDRIACNVGITCCEFSSKHLKPAESGEDSPWIMRDRTCPFLRDLVVVTTPEGKIPQLTWAATGSRKVLEGWEFVLRLTLTITCSALWDTIRASALRHPRPCPRVP